MFVIIEGIDRVGKTTLANKLEKDLGFNKYCINNQFPFDNVAHNVDVNEAILGMMNVCKGNVVFDRFHMTEFVYGCFDRGYNCYAEYLRINERLCKLDDCLLVFVRPFDIKRSVEEHGMDLYKHNNLFEELFNKYEGEKISCDYSTLENAVEYIKEKIND